MAKKPKYNRGEYTPMNPDKYKGTYPIQARSSWELALMRTFDKHPDVIAWGSETIKIPYLNPITNKGSMYIPDFFVVYEDKNGNRKQEIIEVKPASQTHITEAKSRFDKVHFAVNMAKWKAAARFCRNKGLTFRVINENEIFRNPKK